MGQIIKIIISLLVIMLTYITAFAEACNVAVHNNTDHAVRVGVNDPDPNTGKIIPPHNSALLDTPAEKYSVTICWADQDRANHCMCQRQSCDNSPNQIVVKGSVNMGCQGDTLQLRCVP